MTFDSPKIVGFDPGALGTTPKTPPFTLKGPDLQPPKVYTVLRTYMQKKSKNVFSLTFFRAQLAVLVEKNITRFYIKNGQNVYC